MEQLKEFEKLSQEGKIELLYGDESQVCTKGYVPYGRQFPHEEVCMLSQKAERINCFGLINRQSKCYRATAEQNINARFILEYPEEFSLKINKETVVILDNASIHKANIIRKRIPYWQHRGLFLYFPPPCSPHLNIAETIWRKLKKEWIVPEDYIEKETLFYATDRALENLGYELKINFKRFNTN